MEIGPAMRLSQNADNNVYSGQEVQIAERDYSMSKPNLKEKIIFLFYFIHVASNLFDLFSFRHTLTSPAFTFLPPCLI